MPAFGSLAFPYAQQPVRASWKYQKTAAQWLASNPVLPTGTIGIEVDTRMLKFGDGASDWALLPYAASPWDVVALPLASVVYLPLSVWESTDPILSAQQVAYELDTQMIKIGDGVHHWSEIGHVNGHPPGYVPPGSDVPLPEMLTSPVLTGGDEVGDILSVTDGTWSNDPYGFAYHWYVASFEDLTTPTHATTRETKPEDAGQDVRCKVRAINDGGQGAAWSNIIHIEVPV